MRRISELRAVELLEGLCGDKGIGQYVLVSVKISASGRTTDQWRKLTGQEADDMVNSTRCE